MVLGFGGLVMAAMRFESRTAALVVLALSLVLVGLAFPVVSAVHRRRFNMMVSNVRRRRPRARLVPGVIGKNMAGLARSYGASGDDWVKPNRGLMVLAVRRNNVEVWGVGDARPRWRVRRVPGAVSVVSTEFRVQSVNRAFEREELWVDDGERSVRIVPLYAMKWKPDVRADLERALRDLGIAPEVVRRKNRIESVA